MPKDPKEEMRAVGRQADDPAISAVNELGDAFARSVENIETQIELIGQKSDRAGELLTKEFEKFKTEVDKGFSYQKDRLEAIDRRTHALAYIGPQGGTDKLLDGIHETERSFIALAEKTFDPRVDKGRFKDPIFRASTALWFMHSTMGQSKNWATDREVHLKRCEAIEESMRAAFQLAKVDKAAFTTGTDGLGGHLVPDPVEAEMNRLILDNSVLRPAGVRVVPMMTKTLDLPKEGANGLSVSIEGENTQIADSIPASNAVAKVTLTAKRFNGRAIASIESVQDSAVSILGWVQENLTELIARKEDTEGLEGTTNFTGLAADSDVNEIAAAGADGDAITYAKLVSVVFKARQKDSRAGARWFMAPEGMAKVVGLRADAVSAADGAGQPIFQFGNVPGEIRMFILGFPVELHSGILTNRTKGSGTGLTNIYFGPPRRIVFGDRTGMSWDVSDSAGTAFENYQLVMRLVKRTAIAVAVGKAFTRAIDLITT